MHAPQVVGEKQEYMGGREKERAENNKKALALAALVVWRRAQSRIGQHAGGDG